MAAVAGNYDALRAACNTFFRTLRFTHAVRGRWFAYATAHALTPRAATRHPPLCGATNSARADHRRGFAIHRANYYLAVLSVPASKLVAVIVSYHA